MSLEEEEILKENHGLRITKELRKSSFEWMIESWDFRQGDLGRGLKGRGEAGRGGEKNVELNKYQHNNKK